MWFSSRTVMLVGHLAPLRRQSSLYTKWHDFNALPYSYMIYLEFWKDASILTPPPTSTQTVFSN